MRPRSPQIVLSLFALAVLGGLAGGCSPQIGASCSSAFNCSINGDRVCDLSGTNGACTVFGCEADTCPDNAVCVRFRPDPSRLSFTACMQSCETDNNCRYDDGYRCMAASDVTETFTDGVPIAEVVDMDRTDDGLFCVGTVPPAE